jgi:MoxR-like ATPase
MDEQPIFQQRTDLSALNNAVGSIYSELRKVIVGQDEMIRLILTALLADGHVLIEGVPGVAKTLTAKLVAKSVDVGFNRIQFTPDLMPSDVLGTPVFNPREASFEFKKGPVFNNLVLVDEINRAPAKTQSALLEIMEERQASVDGKTYLMANPFMVLATQNPVEHEGTYRLPEAQLDRFLLKYWFLIRVSRRK